MGSAKDSGLLDMSWESLAEVLNKELRDGEDTYYNESAYRKPYSYAKAFYDDVFSKQISSQYSDDILKQKDELYKLKRQFQDQRREYNKLLISDARADHLAEYLLEAVNNLNKEKTLGTLYHHNDTSNVEALLVLADWHYGMVTDNIWNRYNSHICTKRVKELLEQTIRHLNTHHPNVLNIVILGDMAHGAIHTSARVASDELVCDQLIKVSELIAEFVNELLPYVPQINIYSTYGNHMRTVQDKKDNIYADNMEKIIPWWLRQRFANVEEVNVIDSEYHEFIKIDVAGNNICCVHGDLDKFKGMGVTANTLFTKLFGETVDYTVSADKHHLEEFESYDIENILVRSLCGVDEYANNKRLYSNAGQTLIFFTKDDGRLCTYNINLQNIKK